MKREFTTNAIVFCLLVILGVATRWISEATYPKLANPAANEPSDLNSVGLANITATTAAGLFAGFFFVPRLAAFLVPVAIVVLSNLGLPKYNDRWQMGIALVALVLPVVLGWVLQRRPSVMRILGGAAAPAVIFFLLTDLVFLPGQDLYPKTLTGQVDSYIAALPFLRNMLLGDLLFTGLIFGTHWMVASRGVTARPETQLAPAPVVRN